ncbi:hypothetical protein G7Y79_00025g057830 [Physcia stellaris]|nr:hypothetical protein G7Y79_00025g057830 [Physcia stellaris]
MEVMVRNLQHAMTERQTKKFFEPHLNKLGIFTFRVEKHQNKAFALLTFIDTAVGDRFLDVHGQLQLGGQVSRIKVKLYHLGIEAPEQQLIIRYDSVESMATGDIERNNPSISFSLAEAPRIYEKTSPSTEDGMLAQDLLALSLQRPGSRIPYNPVKRKRTSALNGAHGRVVASCLCYRVTLSDNRDMRAVRALNRVQEIPQSVAYNTTVEFDPTHSFPVQMTKLNNALTGGKYAQLSFGTKFQLQRLAQNGYLPPSRVVDLMEAVSQLSTQSSWPVVAKAIQRLSEQIPYAGPATDASELSLQTLSDQLVENVASIVKEQSYSKGLSEQPEHIAQIYKAVVTPTGIYLYGPEPEMKNRVLRKYRSHTDYFLQVRFSDENSEQIWYERVTSQEKIYHVRFKGVLHGNINIAGRGFEFLGFSHSSLRAQTCWFMAPFVIDNQLLYARGVIARLGDFSTIQWPARCAARIGQAFSQTFSSVTLPSDAIRKMPDIKRNGRVFSDGVGTCSPSVLAVIHQAYGQSRLLKPALLQIRFQGAKGMISLDNRLNDHAMYLRPSMIKFEGSTALDIEICGAAFKPLTMYLNRQLIKILEDLGVPDESFLALQNHAVEQLRIATLSPVNAASFLRRNNVGQSVKLPWLVRELQDIGIIYSEDDFLRHILEVCVLVELRELKHRSRIRVDQGMTVYGIMDETGLLQEGQVYCCVENPEGTLILTGSVVVTRCPALHPGDVHQHGERDLPSQLSGGDLDGDLYNIIYDDTLYPQKLSEPADYPIVQPVDIGRQVVPSDMSDFFIQFMENDALGRIASLHQTLADIHDEGVFHPDCIKLAELHSTAVDFSKTGNSVDLDAIPRAPKVKPDFQAPGPRVLMDNIIRIEEVDEFANTEEIEELDEYAPPITKYYPSQKVLGKLYRAIDEHQLFKEIQQPQRLDSHLNPWGNHLDAIWRYVKEKAALIQYEHYLDFARNMKEDYEDNLVHIMFDYSSQPHHFVSEVEVFSGNIIGKNGAQSKRQRDFSTTMKERHERNVEYTIKYILQGEDMAETSEALERSIACLWVGHQEIKKHKKVGRLVSFAWIAASVCLREVEKFRNKLRRGNFLEY